MPVRIYDIAKKLGMESKEVLSKAKELGISAAKVPSSSLDKITAEYLEEQLTVGRVVETAPTRVPQVPIVIVSEPPPEPPPPVEAEPDAAVEAEAVEEVRTDVEEAPAPKSEPESPSIVAAPLVPVDLTPPLPTAEMPISTTENHAPAEPATTAAPTPPAVAPTPLPPPPPPAPRLGDKIGFINLPPRPLPRTSDRGVPPKPTGRPGQPVAPGQVRPQTPGSGQVGPTSDGRGQTSSFGQRSSSGLASRTPGAPGQRVEAGKPAPAKIEVAANATLIMLKPPVIVRDLAEQLKRKPFQLIADLMELGVFATVNQAIDEQVAQRVCAKHGFRFEVEKRERGGGIVHAPLKKVDVDIDDKPEELKPRAPVVTIMGHVDHGKTTLLDVIRKSNVAAGEAGGITQHIGAYTISFPHPERKKEVLQITFLDTPGHAAFSAMRARGANVTDIVVLVVAANDGVMPQTLEALSHAQAAKVPIIVAVNKCDHPNANPLKVRQQLQDKGLIPDDWGGNTIFVDVSALTKKGVDKLLEMILLQAELLELKANPNRRAKGNVIESGLEPGGPTATVLVRKGTLKVGGVVLCGEFWGKVRALINEEGDRLKEAGPSVAVKLLGLNGVPEAGLEFSVQDDEKTARTISGERGLEARNLNTETRKKVTLETLFASIDATSHKALKVVVKADTQGSIEAIVEALKKIESDKVSLDIIHSAVGTITESDVSLASASNAIILGFHSRIDNGVSEAAKREGVQIKLYTIIYELIDEVKEAMAGLLDPILKEVVSGVAEIRKLFALSKGGNVAGCVVTLGRIVKGKVRLMRRKALVYEGVTLSLRRFQDEVNEVRSGMECGIRIEGFNDFQIGDTIECYTVEKIAQKL